jgi:DNA-binding transcriptional LysR family regulator
VSSNAVSNLLQREADIALRMVRPDQGSLVTRRVGQVAIGTYAHRDYLRRRGTPRIPEDLLTHDLIGNDRNTDIVQGFARMGYPIERERFAVRTDDLNAYQAAVDAGLGVGFLARYVARQNPDLVPLLPMLPIPPLPVWLAVHREIRSNPRIRAVWDFLARALPQALS